MKVKSLKLSIQVKYKRDYLEDSYSIHSFYSRIDSRFCDFLTLRLQIVLLQWIYYYLDLTLDYNVL